MVATESGLESSWYRLLWSLSPKQSRRWKRLGRGSCQRRWSVLLVLRRYWYLGLVVVVVGKKKKKHNGWLHNETTVIT